MWQLKKDDTGAKFVPSVLYSEQSDSVRAYLDTEFADRNAKDIEMWNEANRRLDKHIAAIPNFQHQLLEYQALQRRVKQQCPFDYGDCYWNDNGCSIKCLDRIQPLTHLCLR